MPENKQNPIMRIFKNREFHYNLIAVAIFAVISWAFFFPDCFQGNVLKQHDVQQGIAIGQEVKAYSAETGETSRWTNSLFSGMPNFQISPSYGSSSLVSWIGDAYSLWFPAPVSWVFIMLLGFFILLRAFKVKWYLAVLGALAWAFSTYFFIIIGAGHIWKYITLAYIPPTIAGIIWAYRKKYLLGFVTTTLFGILQIAGNHVQMTYYFLFVIVALFIASFFYQLKKKDLKSWGKATGVLAFAAILAVSANSSNLYHTYKYSKETMRGGHSEIVHENSDANASNKGLNKDYITAWSYGIDETFTFIVPNVKGGASIRPEKGENRPMFLSETRQAEKAVEKGELDQQIAPVLGQFFQYFGDQPMTNGPVYIGVIIFALFILGCIIVKGPIKWALLAVTILSILLSWGHNFMGLTDLFIDYFPMYNKFRTVASILVIAEFTIPLLAILALQKLFTEQNLKRYAKSIYISFGITFFFCLLLYIAPSWIIGVPYSAQEVEGYITSGVAQQYPEVFSAVESIRYQMVSDDALRSLFILLIGFVAILLFTMKKVDAKISGGILIVVVLADMFMVNKRYISHDSFMPAPENLNAYITPRPVDTKILADTTQNYRVFDLQHFEEAMPSYFHKCVGGYHAAKLSRYQDLMSYNMQLTKDGPNLNMNVIDMLNTKYFIINDNQFEVNPGALGNAWFVDSIQFVNTANEEMFALYDFTPKTKAIADKKFENVIGGAIPQKAANDTIYETTYAPNRITYHAQSANGGLAVFSEIYFPWGWNATIDGNPAEIGRVNYVLRALKVPAGSHTIEFEFAPASLTVTETLAYIAIIIMYLGIAALIALTIVRKENKTAKE